jgi:hypothetical protein
LRERRYLLRRGNFAPGKWEIEQAAATAPARLLSAVMTQTFDVELRFSGEGRSQVGETAMAPHKPDRPGTATAPKSAKHGCFLAGLFSVHSPINGILGPDIRNPGIASET